MITTGTYFGGPEHLGSAFQEVGARVARLIVAAYGAPVEEWEGRVPGVNVVFYVPGSVMAHASVRTIEAVRFSRKQKLLLVNVPVPRSVVFEWDKSAKYVIDSLRRANATAAEVFAKKRGDTFDLARANAIVDEIEHGLVR